MWLRKLLHFFYKRLVIHWQSFMLSIIIFVSLYLWYLDKIDAHGFIAVLGSLMGVKLLFGKDDNKVPTKTEFQVPDVKPKHESSN